MGSNEKVDVSFVNKNKKPRKLLHNNNSVPARDGIGRFSSGSGGLKNIKKFNWGRALPLIIAVSIVGGYLVYRSFAATSHMNPYYCPKVNGQYPELYPADGTRAASRDGLTGLGDQCVTAVQYAFRNWGNQKQIGTVDTVGNITYSGVFDGATKTGAVNFQRLFYGKKPGYTPDGVLTPEQMATINAYLGVFSQQPPVQTTKWEPKYPGQPRPGKMYLGGSRTNNGDPAMIEAAANNTALGVRRSFCGSCASDAAITAVTDRAKDDIAHSRVPMISLKPPYSWTTMATANPGNLSDPSVQWVDKVLSKLSEVDGPVWLAVNHEPEGGGSSPGPDDPGGATMFLGMNRLVRKRIDYWKTQGKAKNIVLADVLMAWTFDPASGLNYSDWYADGIFDQLGIDTYWLESNSYWSNNIAKGPLLASQKIVNARTFAAAKGVDLAIYEFGFGTLQGNTQASRMHEMYEDMLATPPPGQARIVAASYFNSNLNGGSEVDTSSALFKEFSALLQEPTSTHWPLEISR